MESRLHRNRSLPPFVQCTAALKLRPLWQTVKTNEKRKKKKKKKVCKMVQGLLVWVFRLVSVFLPFKEFEIFCSHRVLCRVVVHIPIPSKYFDVNLFDVNYFV